MTDPAQQPVLFIAYGCEPGCGSEPGIGWAQVSSCALRRPTWVITHPEHRANLDRGIAAWNRRPGVQPITAVYVDARSRGLRGLREPAGAAPAPRGFVGFNRAYARWCRAAGRAAERVHAQVGFALVQHASIMRWWQASPGERLARRGVPFIWGPLGAGEVMPRRYRRGIGLRGHLTELTRLAVRRAFLLNPALRRCARSATLALAEPAETVGRLQALGCQRVERAMALPCDVEQMQRVEPMPKPPGTFRVVSGGGLVYWKMFDQSLRAFARAFGDDPDAQYVHTGGGPELPKMQRVARELGIADRVVLAGAVPHAQSLRWVASADAYVLPVLRDTTGHLFEALAAGVPVLTTNHLAPAAVADASCGHLIPLGPTLASLVDDMALTLRRWRDDPALRRRLSAGARRRAAELGSDAFARRLHAIHDAVLRERAGESSSAVEVSRLPARPAAALHPAA